MKKSKIKLLISINLSLIIGLMTLHSLPLINSEAAIPITISQRQLVANTVTVSSTEYPATNTPSSLENSQILLNGESLFGETLQTIATYTLSNGETYFNFKFGQRYYWINTKACVINPKLISKQSIHQPVYFVTNDYGLYNVPSTQSQAIKLIDGNQAPTTSVQAIAKYTFNDGTSYYNFRYGQRYYWTDVRAFKNDLTIVNKSFSNINIHLTSKQYDFYNTPGNLHDAKTLLKGNSLNNVSTTAIATYKLNDGTSYYNFKYGNRYYWADTRAFTIDFSIIDRQSYHKLMRISSNNYDAYNTPSPLTNSKLLLNGNQQYHAVVQVIAKYKVSNGEWYYNYKYGKRYYWTNSRAFTPEYIIDKRQKLTGTTKIISSSYGAFNTPSPTFQSKKLLNGATLKGQKVQVVAKYHVSNGEWYFNYKYGNRYYWTNSRAFSYYQNPSQYLQIVDTQIKPAGPTPYNIYSGYEGVKVWLAQRKLGINSDGRYGPTTINAVKNFQRRNGIKADGILNLATWNKMGYSTGCWKIIDSYISPLKVHLWNTRSEHIEAMISTAYNYLGKPYINGASSTPDYGVDCSGLTMQSLYAAGINPLPSSSYIHAHPGHEWESRNLWANEKLKKVSYNQRQRGDLIFYYSPYDGKIWHVAIYLGNNQVIESWPPKVMVQPIKNNQRSWIAGVKRPFV